MVYRRSLSAVSAKDYAAAIRRAVTAEDVTELMGDLLEIATYHPEIGPDATPDARNVAIAAADNKLRAAEFIINHVKGRPGVAPTIPEAIELPKVTDAASALEAYNVLLGAMARGALSIESAKSYSDLIGSAAKIALATSAVELLASGGRPEFVLDADAPIESQMGDLRRFVEQGIESMRRPTATLKREDGTEVEMPE